MPAQSAARPLRTALVPCALANTRSAAAIGDGHSSERVVELALCHRDENPFARAQSPVLAERAVASALCGFCDKAQAHVHCNPYSRDIDGEE
jgi:hypothetical protein